MKTTFAYSHRIMNRLAVLAIIACALGAVFAFSPSAQAKELPPKEDAVASAPFGLNPFAVSLELAPGGPSPFVPSPAAAMLDVDLAVDPATGVSGVYKYTGKPITPVIAVNCYPYIKPVESLRVEYKDNIEPGEATYTIYLTDGAEYTDTFRIIP